MIVRASRDTGHLYLASDDRKRAGRVVGPDADGGFLVTARERARRGNTVRWQDHGFDTEEEAVRWLNSYVGSR